MRQEGGEKKTCEGEERESPEREGGREWGEGKRKPERGYLCGRALARVRDVGACLQFGVPAERKTCAVVNEGGWWRKDEGEGKAGLGMDANRHMTPIAIVNRQRSLTVVCGSSVYFQGTGGQSRCVLIVSVTM